MRQQAIKESRGIVSRRRFLAGIGIGAMGGGLVRPSAVWAAEPIIQPGSPGVPAFIARAFEMRQLSIDHGDEPYGAVVVLDGQIIGQSWSRVLLDRDPTAHAEMSAIRDAARRRNGGDLSAAILYSSSRPCAMCEAAAAWVGIEAMIHGQSAIRAGSPHLCR